MLMVTINEKIRQKILKTEKQIPSSRQNMAANKERCLDVIIPVNMVEI